MGSGRTANIRKLPACKSSSGEKNATFEHEGWSAYRCVFRLSFGQTGVLVVVLIADIT